MACGRRPQCVGVAGDGQGAQRRVESSARRALVRPVTPLRVNACAYTDTHGQRAAARPGAQRCSARWLVALHVGTAFSLALTRDDNP
eukprot:scaffold2084_cov365-Prasinococcus_capsulatus_cf.AAC.5